MEIVEKHHKDKQDSPSGTAKSICDTIRLSKEEKPTMVYGRKGNEKRKPTEIGIHSIRGGTVVGEHSVYFLGKDETITLTHTANSKKLFARGAINCAEFIVKQGNGLYGMNDLIDF